MDLKNKLKGFPPIYYINLDSRKDRKEYMESQFKYWKIDDFKRISASKYLPSQYNEWKQFVFENKLVETVPLMSTHINHVKTIVEWLDSNVSETCLIMEDDLSLDNIQYWNFDWEYFQSKLPENWDCVQLYFCRNDYIPCFLHKRLYHSCSSACYLINRMFAEKIKKIMIVGELYKIKLSDNLYERNFTPSLVENLFDVGVTYSVPLFHISDYGSDHYSSKKLSSIDFNSSKIIQNWWKKDHHKFTLDDFFTYGKPNDNKMTKTSILYD